MIKNLIYSGTTQMSSPKFKNSADDFTVTVFCTDGIYTVEETKETVEITGLAKCWVEWNFSKLKEFIERIGPNKGGYWRVKK
jgi:hypothetical protein